MIFLAVTMGFIAENIREKISDRKKEKEYINSLLQDLRTDTAQINDKQVSLYAQMYGMDTLETLLNPEINANDSAVFKCYQLRQYLMNQHMVGFSDRTITQLVSSGNMRLIGKQSVSDSISQYYSTIRDVEAQKTYYVEYFHKCLDIFPSLYSFDSYHSTLNADGTVSSPDIIFGKLRIVTTDPVELAKFKSTIEITKGVAGSYRYDIIALGRRAKNLIDFLQKEYGLE